MCARSQGGVMTQERLGHGVTHTGAVSAQSTLIDKPESMWGDKH